MMRYSVGKDSSMMLHLAQKAFHLGPIPFPLMHIDTTCKFRDMTASRDHQAGETIRVFPLSNCSGDDVWSTIRQENIPIAPLYFATARTVVKRMDQWILVDDDRPTLKSGESPQTRMVSFPTLRCYPLTAAIERTATMLDEIMPEAQRPWINVALPP